MPSPVPGELHVDRFLTGMMIGYSQSQDNFVADAVFPTVPVAHESDIYVIWPKGAFFRDELKPRPLGGRPPQVGYKIEHGRYHATEWALEHSIDDRVRTNADQPIDPDMAATRLLTSQALIRRDRLWADAFFKAGVWGADWEGVSSGPSGKKFLQFDQTGAEPIKFFRQRRTEMAKATGFRPNVLVLGSEVRDALLENSSIIARIQYTQRAIVTEEILAAMFGVEKVVVPEGVYNTAQEGAADSITWIVDPKSALLVHAAPNPSLEEPSAGYTFAYTGLIPGMGNALGGVMERGREDLAHSDIFQIRAAFDVQATATDLGQFFEKVIA